MFRQCSRWLFEPSRFYVLRNIEDEKSAKPSEGSENINNGKCLQKMLFMSVLCLFKISSSFPELYLNWP